MRFISETTSRRLVDQAMAMESTRRALIAAADGSSELFRVVHGHAADAGNRFSIKSGSTENYTGLKVGSYWHANGQLGLPCHSSCILLFDERIGRLGAVVEASRANVYRTAAADAWAVDRLSRPDSSRLAIFGAGGQAYFECLAVMKMRPISHVAVVNRDRRRAAELADKLRAEGVTAEVASADEACAQADIVVTATSARSPLFDAASIKPGTHISLMGADAIGKQEAPVELLRRAELFCDYDIQSYAIGEFQHVVDEVRGHAIPAAVNLGDVLAGRHPGRTRNDAITVFDSSGLVLQDLFLASALLEKADAEGEVSVL